MKLTRFDAAEYTRVRDIPPLLWDAAVVDRHWGYFKRCIVLSVRVVLTALGVIALSGCATTRYVTVPCLTKDQAIPAEPERVKSKLTGQADQDLRIVAGSAIRLRSWGEGLQSILEGCREK